MEVQILLMKKASLTQEELTQRLEKVFNQLKKLNQRLEIAYSDLNDDSLSSWDLKILIEEALAFWEADLTFKHNVAKEILEEKKGEVKFPNNLIRGFFCGLGELLFLSLKEGRLWIKINGELLEFSWDRTLEPPSLERLKTFLEGFTTLIDFDLNHQRLSLKFKSYEG
ncbi:hypothetical protein F1847_06025 [Thermodesulfobacterium sp. TA1]|nr:hypothetical protein F1847_06025 [Thermodesulfobacterium sp. TA1]